MQGAEGPGYTGPEGEKGTGGDPANARMKCTETMHSALLQYVVRGCCDQTMGNLAAVQYALSQGCRFSVHSRHPHANCQCTGA